MNSESNAVSEFRAESQSLVSATMPWGRLMYWSVRRELWENRSIYIAPLVVTGVILLGFAFTAITLPLRMHTREELRLGAANPPEVLAGHEAYGFASGLIMGITFIVGLFYCLDALHGERRDRSILFWKSLPVSDLTAVLSKASIPIVILPLFTFALTFITQWIMLFLHTVALAGSGLNATTPGTHGLIHMQTMLLYHLVTVHILWHAPIYAWLLLVSAWARRAPFLWAFVPPVAICIVERIVSYTTHFAAMLGYRFGGPEAYSFAFSRGMDPMMRVALGRFLAMPGLWGGLAVAAIFLAGAVRVRRYREPI
jgi:ABC-2 type transport system permease protein